MLLFPKDIVLEDDRVMLRPLEYRDLETLLPFTQEKPSIWPFSINILAGRDDMDRYILATLKQRDLEKEYPFIVFDKSAGSCAGSTRFYDIQLGFSTTQLGYTWYGHQFQRTGLNRHCKLLLLSYAFESWGMERVEFRADVNNLRSIAAMKAIGCVEEGVLRSHVPTEAGTRRDSIVLSILKREWFGGGKEQLLRKIYS